MESLSDILCRWLAHLRRDTEGEYREGVLAGCVGYVYLGDEIPGLVLRLSDAIITLE